MTPEAFRVEADAFDAKVQDVRRVREAKNVELQVASATARALFEDRVQGIIANTMLERGAFLVLEQRTVVLSVRAANITDDVIVRVDAELGDGTR
jgi:Skp family chaperone for outer membrane proteins